MTDGSLCAMGGLTPMPVMSALRHFPEDFNRPAPRRSGRMNTTTRTPMTSEAEQHMTLIKENDYGTPQSTPSITRW